MKKLLICAMCIATTGLYAQQPPSWELTGEIPSATHVFDVVETGTGTLLAGTYWTTYHIQRSTDGGNTWTGVGPQHGAVFCSDLEVTPGGRIYAVISAYNGSVIYIYYSTDDGMTWTQLSQPRVPLYEVFYPYLSGGSIYPIGLKYYNGILYVFGRSRNLNQGPIFHGEVWYYVEATNTWGKYDLAGLNADDGGWTIETGPGPTAGTYLYLGTYNTGRVIRFTNPLLLNKEKTPAIKEK